MILRRWNIGFEADCSACISLGLGVNLLWGHETCVNWVQNSIHRSDLSVITSVLWLTLQMNGIDIKLWAFRFWANSYFLLSDLTLILTFSDLHLWRLWHCQKYNLWNWSFWQRQRYHSKSNRLSGKLGFDFGLELCWRRFKLCHSDRRRKCICGYWRNLLPGHYQVLFLLSSLLLKRL